MNRGLLPIVLTLLILALVFGVWYVGVRERWWIRNSANDFELCRNEAGDSLIFKSKDPLYAITGFSSRGIGDGVMYMELLITRGYGRELTLEIDTMRIHTLDFYGRRFSIKEIPFCK